MVGAILTLAGFVATAFIVALAVYGGFCLLVRIEERFRPIEPRDDLLGDLPNVSGFFHERGDTL